MVIFAEEGFNSPVLGIIIWCLFGVAILFIVIKSIIGSKKTAKKKENTVYDDYSIMNEHNKGYEKEPLKKYYFHYAGKLNQGHVLEDENHKVIYEANKEHITLASAEEFEFINHVSNKKTIHKIGHTVTNTTAIAGFGMAHSRFSFDDEKNIWQYLDACGYSYKTDLKKLTKPSYIISYEGKEIAVIQVSGVHLFEKEKSKGKLYDALPAPGYYRVECKDSDLDAVFLFCLALARTESSQEHYKNNNLFE